MKNLWPILLLFCVFTTVLAQAQYNPDKISKKAKEAYNKALEQADEGAYTAALQSLNEAVAKDANYVDAYLSLGGIYRQIKQHDQSVAAYEKAIQLDSNYTFEYRLPYSISLAGSGQFERALHIIDGLLAKQPLNPNTRKAAEYRRKTFALGMEMGKTNPPDNYKFNPKNVGNTINSIYSEYWPSMNLEGTLMIFTRKERDEDFFVSEKTKDGWGDALRLNGAINTPDNEGAQMISQDGEWLVFAGKNRPGGYGDFDIFISYKTPQGWSQEINLGGKVNTEFWDSQPCLSPDKRTLYFASKRPGGFGNSDLYMSQLQPNGRFGEAVNMGPGINTPGEETSPFLHADGQTLYFSSDGWPGLGAGDLFMVRRSDSSWSKPTNLGYPINTIDNEATLFIAADAKTAFYASDRSGGNGRLDIYSFELRSDIRPAKTLWVKGKVFDSKTNSGLPSAVELIDLATNKPISRVQTTESGEYLVTLPTGKDYAFNVARKGYLFYSDNFSLKQQPSDSTYQKDIPLQPIEVDASVVLKNIFFDVAKYDLKPESAAELDKVVQLLNENPTIKILIEGHTDNVGAATANTTLSQARAKAVISYLSAKGIAASRLQAKGFGATKPIADNSSEESRAQNRRTELKIVGK